MELILKDFSTGYSKNEVINKINFNNSLVTLRKECLIISKQMFKLWKEKAL